MALEFNEKKSLSEQQATLTNQLATSQFELAKKEAVPDITVGLGVRQYQETDDKVFLLSTSIPLPLFNRQQGKVAIAQAEQNLAEARAGLTQRNSAIDLENRQIQISSLIDTLKQYDQGLLPATNESLRIAELGYQAGKISLLEFSSIKQVWLEKNLARHDLWLKLQNEIADVERQYITAQKLAVETSQ